MKVNNGDTQKERTLIAENTKVIFEYLLLNPTSNETKTFCKKT